MNAAMATSERLYTWEEVAQHNSVSTGVWVVVEGRIYDVTQFVDEHPGGEEVLLDNAGKDATSAFTDVGHSNNAIQLRESFLIGHIADQYSPPKETVQTQLKVAAGVAAGLLVPALAVAAVAVAVYLIYRRYKK